MSPDFGGVSEISLPTRQKIIAIVDDDSGTLDAIGLLLDAHGFGVRAFDSAEAFLERDAGDQVDCLVLDIHLGGVSGIDLQRRLVAAGSTLPVIFMTALDDAATRAHALRAGCVAYLQKPVHARQLMDAIHKGTP
jgi:FixJ family two-component response regulator